MHTKSVYRATFLALLLGALLVGAVGAFTVIVDGNPADWGLTPPLVTDINEGAITDNVDINTFYVTNNLTTLFFRLDTYGSPTRWAPVGGGSGGAPYVAICLNTDNNTGTGVTDVNCNNQPGVDHVVRVEGSSFGTISGGILQCPTGSPCAPAGQATTAMANAVTEVGVPLSLLGITPTTCTTDRAVPGVIYFDNQSTDPDDNIPGSGTITIPIDCPPLAVTLASFGATDAGSHVRVTWETALEIGNVGFNILRATSADGEPTRVNGTLIPANGQPSTYGWSDTGVQPNTTYFYWLEAVASDGSTTRHGPTSVAFQPSTAVTLSTLASTAQGNPLLPMVGALLALGTLALVARARRQAR